jgi:hypothetical protein
MGEEEVEEFELFNQIDRIYNRVHDCRIGGLQAGYSRLTGMEWLRDNPPPDGGFTPCAPKKDEKVQKP